LGDALRSEGRNVQVVDVRQQICGAVIEDSGKEKIKVGDRLWVDASEVSLK
jgi:hypothetical protein